jgi:hypothetical protein
VDATREAVTIDEARAIAWVPRYPLGLIAYDIAKPNDPRAYSPVWSAVLFNL